MNSQPYLQAHCQSPASQHSSQRFAKELTKPARLAHRAFGIAQAQKTK
jgi:hypothetical protein